MKIFPAFTAMALGMAATAAVAADLPPGAWFRGPPAKSPVPQKAPLELPPLALQPMARGFVQNPLWRRPVRVAHRPTYHFRFRQTLFAVLGGPYFIQPMNYAYVATPYFPATFYDPNDPGAGYNLFYCPNPAGYFPDVADCPSGWWSTVPEAAPEG
ncbi:MAG TPA: hypothetical protein VN598_17500 [Usitatibacter sp.]|nr:hypothetical protein [Usitatibacter sp.]